MTAPAFLSTGFATSSLPGTTVDVTDIINAVATLLTSTLSSTPTELYPSGERWTSLGGGAYKSPVDSAGRYMTVTFTRTSATRLKFDVADPTSTIMNGPGGAGTAGEIDIAAGGSVVNMFAGPGHLVIEANNGGTWETAQAIMSEPTPEPLLASPIYVWGRALRNSGTGSSLANAALLTHWLGRYQNLAVPTAYVSFTAPTVMVAQNTTNTFLRTQAGSEVAAPAYISPLAAIGTGPAINVGRLYQHVLVDGNQLAGADLNIPVDTGVTGQFHVLRLGPAGSCQMAVRKA